MVLLILTVEVDYVIPANDDAIRAVKLIVAAMADAICEAKSEPLTVAYVKDEDEKEMAVCIFYVAPCPVPGLGGLWHGRGG